MDKRKKDTILLACGLVLLALCSAGILTYMPQWLAAYRESEARAAAQDAAERALHAKHPWERLPQASQEDVTAFAENFLRRLGYTRHGEIVYTGWTTTDAWGGAYKQYEYYAVIDPAWPPLRLRCGPWGYYEMGPLTCTILPHRE